MRTDWRRHRRTTLAAATARPSRDRADRLRDVVHSRPGDAGPVIAPGAARSDGLAHLEAALFAAEDPLTPRRLAKLAGLPDTGEVRRQVARLNELYDRDGNAFRVEEIAGGYQLLTRPELRPWLDQFCQLRDEAQLSGPSLETLAIIAYRQPIPRADVEAIRGVQVGEVLRQLLDRGLVRIVGREDSLGRPFLYGTTKQFLRVFGLRNLHELPLVEILARPAATQTPEPAPEDAPADASADAPDDDD